MEARDGHNPYHISSLSLGRQTPLLASTNDRDGFVQWEQFRSPEEFSTPSMQDESPRFYSSLYGRQSSPKFRNSYDAQGFSPMLGKMPRAKAKMSDLSENTEYSPANSWESWVHKPLPQQPNSRWKRFQYRFNDMVLNSWLTEVASWGFAACCFGATVFILFIWDKHPLPHLPQGITLNTLLTLFVTLTTTALMVPVSQGISQLKWVWFIDCSRRAIDFETFDKASRGSYGSLVLMTKMRWNNLASLGALITILVLGANTFAQQSIKYVPVLVPDFNGSAISRRCTKVGALENFLLDPHIKNEQLDLATQGAIYSGMLPSDGISPLAPSCSTGNCTWPVYETLAVCASLANVTDHVTSQCMHTNEEDGFFICNATLPGVPTINQMSKGGTAFIIQSIPFPETPEHHDKRTSSLAFAKIENYNKLADFFVLWGSHNGKHQTFQAVEINLQYCLQVLESNVTRGKAWTDIKEVYANVPWVTPNHSEPYFVSPRTSENYFVRAAFQTVMRRFMDKQFTANFKIPEEPREGFVIKTVGEQAVVSALQLGRDDDGTSPSHTMTRLALFAENLATSLTNYFRISSNGDKAAIGHAHALQTFVVISWAWVSMLGFIVFASLVFLVGVIIINTQTECKLWKASNLALLQALDSADRPVDFVGLKDASTMHTRARNINLHLRRDGESVLTIGNLHQRRHSYRSSQLMTP